jgi:SAC3/GANP family
MQSGYVINRIYMDLAASADGLGGWLMSPALSPDVLNSLPFVWALALTGALRRGDWVAFFALLRQATHVQACLAHMLFLEVRLHRLSTCPLL